MAYTTIDNPALFFNTVLYAGSNSSQSVTGVGFQPDWVWIKNRSSTPDHMLNDAVRGAGKQINSNTTTAELDRTYFTSFDSDGFTLEGNVSDYNQNSSNFASWNWLAGGSTSSNSDGSITSTVSANTTAGFSIVTYTGNGTSNDSATIGHGLGVTLDAIIIKGRSHTANWIYGTSALGYNSRLQLNNTVAKADGTYAFGVSGVTPSSTTFTVSASSGDDHTNASSNTYVAYCFAAKKGYSKFGSYEGNGNSDGTFVYTGFKPAFVITKRADTGGDNWHMLDNKRDIDNPAEQVLQPNGSDAEATTSTSKIDFLSNGFKCRGTGSSINTSGLTYIYIAFAETPFVTSGTKAAGTAR